MKYEWLRDKLIEKGKNKEILDEYAKSVYGISKEEFFTKVSKNELIACFCSTQKGSQWEFIKQSFYKSLTVNDIGKTSYPLDLLENIQSQNHY